MQLTSGSPSHPAVSANSLVIDRNHDDDDDDENGDDNDDSIDDDDYDHDDVQPGKGKR